jgi:ribonuclease HI
MSRATREMRHPGTQTSRYICSWGEASLGDRGQTLFWTVFGTLAGAALGIFGALLVQRQARRAEDARFERSRLAQRREELRAAIDALIDATQSAERAAGQKDSEIRSDAHQKLWTSHKRLTMLTSGRLTAATDEYCDLLNECLWSPTEEPAWVRVSHTSRRFRQVAGEELKAADLELVS